MIFFFNQFEYDVLAIEFLKILKIIFINVIIKFFYFFYFHWFAQVCSWLVLILYTSVHGMGLRLRPFSVFFVQDN